LCCIVLYCVVLCCVVLCCVVLYLTREHFLRICICIIRLLTEIGICFRIDGGWFDRLSTYSGALFGFL
jgi:hypothetical protein